MYPVQKSKLLIDYQNVLTLTVSHINQLHDMSFTISEIAIGQQPYTDTDAFNFLAAPSIAIKQIDVPKLDLPYLID